MLATLTAINRYPVKSCRGERLETATVEPWGLAGDRRWMVVDPTGRAVTAREVNALVLLRPELIPAGLRLGAPGLTPLDVATPASGARRVQLFGNDLVGVPADPAAGAWLSAALGTACDLVWCADPTLRAPDPAFSAAGDSVSFADGYPLLMATEESLAALNDEIAGGGALPMTRFRPNVVVRGAAAWAEDDWRRLRIGTATFRVVKGCARCVLTTVDPETAERGKEPIATLARIRRWDGSTWFGVNLVPDSPGSIISVGDDVEVLEAVAPGGGPLRPAPR
ncbi:MOSC domain-containing protein [soil metagenome]